MNTSEMPVLDYFNQHYVPSLDGDILPGTIANLRTGVVKFCLFMTEPPTVGDITPDAIQAFRAVLLEVGICASSVSAYHSIIRKIHAHAMPDEHAQMDWPTGFDLRGERIGSGATVPGSLREFFRTVYKPLKLRGKSDSAVRLHEITLNNFAKFLGHEATFEDATSETISRFLSWLRDRGRAAITANDNRNRLMALLRFAVRKHKLEDEPEVEAEIEPERAPRAWTEADLEKLFQECGRQTGTIAGTPAALWWSTLHLVALFTGERISALLSIRWEQIDFERGWLSITAEQRKGKKSDKEWPLPVEALEALRRMEAYKTGDVVFLWPWSSTYIYRHYNKLLICAGLPTDRQSKFHRMRKSTASHFAAKGGNATSLLGHSSARVTKAYLDKRIVKDVAAMELVNMPLAAAKMFAAGGAL